MESACLAGAAPVRRGEGRLVGTQQRAGGGKREDAVAAPGATVATSGMCDELGGDDYDDG